MTSILKVDNIQKANGSTPTASDLGINTTGTILQVKNFQTGDVNTGTTVIPLDDTIPQITEGDEYMTLAITPTSATSRLEIRAEAFLTATVGGLQTVCLFVGTTANALACSMTEIGGVNRPVSTSLTHNMVAGVTTELTFRIRAGQNAGATTTFNGRIGARLYGGTAASSITITEIGG